MNDPASETNTHVTAAYFQVRAVAILLPSPALKNDLSVFTKPRPNAVLQLFTC